MAGQIPTLLQIVCRLWAVSWEADTAATRVLRICARLPARARRCNPPRWSRRTSCMAHNIHWPTIRTQHHYQFHLSRTSRHNCLCKLLVAPLRPELQAKLVRLQLRSQQKRALQPIPNRQTNGLQLTSPELVSLVPDTPGSSPSRANQAKLVRPESLPSGAQKATAHPVLVWLLLRTHNVPPCCAMRFACHLLWPVVAPCRKTCWVPCHPFLATAPLQLDGGQQLRLEISHMT
mmetsp:Transcript_65892/g.117114  ORF Transcript_65892/g.117114 Transcript_65892/m.117114 type:complete len:233 (-) Transcript_65892:3-701(-)